MDQKNFKIKLSAWASFILTLVWSHAAAAYGSSHASGSKREYSLFAQAETPSSPLHAEVKIQCIPGKGGGRYLLVAVHGAHELKSFNFNEFEGPDAAFGNKPLSTLNVRAAKDSLTLSVSGAGWYSDASDFIFSLSLGSLPRATRLRLASILVQDNPQFGVVFHEFKRPAKKISLSVSEKPFLRTLSDILKNGCE